MCHNNQNIRQRPFAEQRRSLAALKLSSLVFAALLSGCAFQTYTAKPLDLNAISSELRARDPMSVDFEAFLRNQGYTDSQLPLKSWGLNELTYSALYFHPDLDVARATWRASVAAEKTAGQRPNPGISVDSERHSETSGGISPWLFGLAIDIPIETGGKRQARIDRATSLSEAARIEIAQTAWKVRSRVHASWIAYQASAVQSRLLEQELALRSEIVEMIEARLRAGMASSLESTNARLLMQRTRQSLDSEKALQVELRARLATHAGLSANRLGSIELTDDEAKELQARRQAFAQDPAQQDKLQEAALLNRLDIRAGLARYDAAEARLRLEIARQYPDITLSPGYSYDQGDKIWSLGFSTLLSLLNRNEGNIAEADAQRELEAARFKALQAEVIGELDSRRAAYLQTLSTLNDSRQLLDAQRERTGMIERQFEQGIADRLELTTARLENLLLQQALVANETRVRRAAHALEEALQHPLENPLPMPADPEGRAATE